MTPTFFFPFLLTEKVAAWPSFRAGRLRGGRNSRRKSGPPLRSRIYCGNPFVCPASFTFRTAQRNKTTAFVYSPNRAVDACASRREGADGGRCSRRRRLLTSSATGPRSHRLLVPFSTARLLPGTRRRRTNERENEKARRPTTSALLRFFRRLFFLPARIIVPRIGPAIFTQRIKCFSLFFSHCQGAFILAFLISPALLPSRVVFVVRLFFSRRRQRPFPAFRSIPSTRRRRAFCRSFARCSPCSPGSGSSRAPLPPPRAPQWRCGPVRA